MIMFPWSASHLHFRAVCEGSRAGEEFRTFVFLSLNKNLFDVFRNRRWKGFVLLWLKDRT